MKKSDQDPGRCEPGSGCCGPKNPAVDRRDFLKASVVGAAAMMVPGMPLFAGPFDENEYMKYVPADKRLDPAWVRSLYKRGTKETYSDPEALRHIGMPVGGLFAGTLYLSGDGRLWLWDIFNRDQEGIQPREIEYQGSRIRTRDGANYVDPAKPVSPFRQGFEILVNNEVRSLDAGGFANITFEGRYPMARIRFSDPNCPVEVTLECFSPFIPLSADDSSLPATILDYSFKNLTDKPVKVVISGFTANPVCLDTAPANQGKRVNRIIRKKRFTAIECSARPLPPSGAKPRADILFEDFESKDFGRWTATGNAFGSGPVLKSEIPEYQGDVGGSGSRVVNSHATAPGSSIGEKDGQTGILTSQEFTISRKFIAFDIGGGANPGLTCLELIINNETVASATGDNSNRMSRKSIATAAWEGQKARIRIADRSDGGWGNIGVDHIVFTDTAPDAQKLGELRDFGTFCLALLNPGNHKATANESQLPSDEAVSEKLTDLLSGRISQIMVIDPQASGRTTFAFTWHFPNFYGRVFGGTKVGHHYAALHSSASAVVRYLADNQERLLGSTRLWTDTWYDSTLPFWMLDRTMANTSTLATTTCYRHHDGRFWAWEGIGCCEGTCTHVWHYAQAPGRLFPEIERDQRQRVDFGLALKEDGLIGYRAMLTHTHGPAFDGQCGRILGVLREHRMSAGNSFLKEIYPRVKMAIEYMIRQDENADGIIEGSQPNTLDASWYGKISFISSLYLAALRAGEAMAGEMNDQDFARRCAAIADRGRQSMLELYNGEYFIQIEDPEHADVIGVGQGCYIDQIFGQTWAHWAGLGNLFDREQQLSALRALWKYNFVPDIGPFRRHFKAGRWYAMAGDGGLIMCSWPKGGKRDKWEDQWQFMYFNECMSGFEWQAAAHMIYEGIDQPDILQNGLAVSRAIHDRYNAHLRNPYNEIECSDHYSRAMASYGVFQAVCGFEYDGPNGSIGFDPRLTPENFRAPFVTAEGWGTYRQEMKNDVWSMAIEVKSGQLRLKRFAGRNFGKKVNGFQVKVNGKSVKVLGSRVGEGRFEVEFAEVVVGRGELLDIG